jgi:hypothetical protein
MLNPVRRIEAKKLLTYLVENEFFNADRFVDLLAEVMAGTPEVVKVAAARLQSWNDGDGSDRPRFARQGTEYAEIAEVVLDAATVYRGETSEEPYKQRLATTADLGVWRGILTTLRSNRDCFHRAASGSISKGVAEAQAAACSRAIRGLEEIMRNAGEPVDDTRV